jgi:hypothetical protein
MDPLGHRLDEARNARSASAQALKLPTPGRTIRSAARTTSGLAVIVTLPAPAAFSALATEWRLPAP